VGTGHKNRYGKESGTVGHRHKGTKKGVVALASGSLWCRMTSVLGRPGIARRAEAEVFRERIWLGIAEAAEPDEKKGSVISCNEFHLAVMRYACGFTR
jgi:hypothetical protein